MAMATATVKDETTIYGIVFSERRPLFNPARQKNQKGQRPNKEETTMPKMKMKMKKENSDNAEGQGLLPSVWWLVRLPCCWSLVFCWFAYVLPGILHSIRRV